MREITLSHSSLGSVSKCMTQAWLSKVCGLTTREASAPLKAGSAGHEGLAEWYRTQDAGKAFVKFGEYKPWADENVLADDVRSWENASEIFWALVCGLDAEKLPYTWKASEVEQHVEVEWGVVQGVEVRLQGFIDLPVSEKSTGARYLMDHKFTGWLKRDTVEGFKLSAQFKCYAWMWEKAREEMVEGVYVNAVEWSRIPKVQWLKSGKEKKCRKHGVVYSECRLHHANKQLVPMTLMPGDLEVWKENTQELVSRLVYWLREYEHLDPKEVVSKMPQEGTFSGACGRCEFKRFCASGRQRGLQETMMVPREGRGGKV